MDWKLAYEIFRDVLLLAFFVYTVWANREKVNAKRFKTLENNVAEKTDRKELQKILADQENRCTRHRERTGNLEAGLGRLQTEVHLLPSQADIGRVHARMDDVLGLVKELGGEMKASRHQLNLVLEQLLGRDK